jgi:hypothetical protein
MAGTKDRLAELIPRPFGIVHAVWLVLILAGCVVLVTMGGGHPPSMIFVPPLLVAGLVGHLLLLLVAWLLRKGVHASWPRRSSRCAGPSSWS